MCSDTHTPHTRTTHTRTQHTHAQHTHAHHTHAHHTHAQIRHLVCVCVRGRLVKRWGDVCTNDDLICQMMNSFFSADMDVPAAMVIWLRTLTK
jgi:hypothetical protein